MNISPVAPTSRVQTREVAAVGMLREVLDQQQAMGGADD